VSAAQAQACAGQRHTAGPEQLEVRPRRARGQADARGAEAQRGRGSRPAARGRAGSGAERRCTAARGERRADGAERAGVVRRSEGSSWCKRSGEVPGGRAARR
jgi:hypothetical protein